MKKIISIILILVLLISAAGCKDKDTEIAKSQFTYEVTDDIKDEDYIVNGQVDESKMNNTYKIPYGEVSIMEDGTVLDENGNTFELNEQLITSITSMSDAELNSFLENKDEFYSSEEEINKYIDEMYAEIPYDESDEFYELPPDATEVVHGSDVESVGKGNGGSVSGYVEDDMSNYDNPWYQTQLGG